MGCWGVKAMESDIGLDYLGYIEDELLSREEYKYFHVKAVVYLLKYKAIKRQEAWLYHNYLEEAQYQFDYYYDNGVILLAECLTEYIKKGNFRVSIYSKENEKVRYKRISQFVYTIEDITDLLTDLQTVLNSERDLYKSWEESESFKKWTKHINYLIQQITSHLGSMKAQ